jgi:hypothetical protein
MIKIYEENGRLYARVINSREFREYDKGDNAICRKYSCLVEIEPNYYEVVSQEENLLDLFNNDRIYVDKDLKRLILLNMAKTVDSWKINLRGNLTPNRAVIMHSFVKYEEYWRNYLKMRIYKQLDNQELAVTYSERLMKIMEEDKAYPKDDPTFLFTDEEKEDERQKQERFEEEMYKFRRQERRTLGSCEKCVEYGNCSIGRYDKTSYKYCGNL